MTMQDNLHKYMQDKGLSMAQAAKRLGKSAATVSLYLAGNYRGDVAGIDEAVAQLLAREGEKAATAYREGFVRTAAAKRALGMIRTAHVEGKMGVLTGSAGVGKTEILKQYTQDNRSAVLIETDPSCVPKTLLRRIAKAIGTTTIGTNDTLFEEIVAKLKGAEMLLLIDEAELLSTRSLEFVRRIKDLSGVGVVLAGMPRLLVNLKGRKEDLKQLYSRVAFGCNLGQELAAEDLRALLRSGLGEGCPEDAFIRHAKGNARRLSLLMQGAARMAAINEEPLNAEMVEQYASYLIG